VRQAYGLAEAAGLTHVNLRAAQEGTLDSVGRGLPWVDWRIVDPASGAELGPGQSGELLVRGPQVMKGYLNQPEATAAMIDRDGWLRTGDVVYADAEGDFHVVDRVKELIKYKGYQVPPAELEALLLTHPAVADCAVIPVPDEEAGEVPKAYVVLKGEATADALMAYVAERAAPYKKLRAVELTDQIPKSASGKILRRVLVERERAQLSI
jgi:acyl-CoA synthetase (AMP-forming)/AMP-acid ligase II